jgi:hypothetical protein
MGARLLVPPLVEPIALEEAKAHLRYGLDDQDDRIVDAIRSARDAVERYCERALLTQTWELQGRPGRAGWPGGGGGTEGLAVTDSHRDWFTHDLLAVRWGAPGTPAADGCGIALPWAAPLQGVEAVSCDGVAVAAGDWIADPTTEPATLYVAGGAWGGWLVVTYRCGAVAAIDVPPALKQATYALLGTYFRWRGDELEPTPEASALPLEVQRLLDPYRLAALA